MLSSRVSYDGGKRDNLDVPIDRGAPCIHRSGNERLTRTTAQNPKPQTPNPKP